MDFKYIKKLGTEKQVRGELLKLLLVCDEDFEPSLSSSRLKDDPDATKEDKLNEYIKKTLTGHEYIFGYKNGKMVGFMNFIKNYSSEYNPEVFQHLKKISLDKKNIVRVDTMCFLPEYRNRGFAQKLYFYFEDVVFDANNVEVSVRSTWKKNEKQRYLFKKSGYDFLFESLSPKDGKTFLHYYYKSKGEGWLCPLRF